MEYLEGMVFWHWWVAAILFVILEIFAPGAVVIWFGASAAFIGLLVFLMPELSWEIQFGLWGALSLAAVIVSRRYLKKNPIHTDRPTLNKRGSEYVGRTYTLENGIENGWGKLNVDDTTWKVTCSDDLSAGEKVKVTGVDGTVLNVEKA